MMPTISVIIPTYNRAGLVTRAIESVMLQTAADWELIVVDSSPADETAAAVGQYVRTDPRILLLRRFAEGPGALRNAGIEQADGDFVAFLDDDDRWLPEKLARQRAFMEAHPEAALSFTYAAGGVLADGAPDPRTAYGRPIQESVEDLLNWPNFISTSSVMIRRECLETVGGFDPGYDLCEDFDLWLRLALRWPIAALEEVLTVHGERDGRTHLTHDPIRNQLAAIRVLQNLRLTPATERYRRRKQRHIARLHYSVARDLIDAKRYTQAGRHFRAALATDPLVGAMVRRPGENGGVSLSRLIKPYLAVLWCGARG